MSSTIKDGYSVGFRVTRKDYEFLDGLAKFFYDHKVIDKPSVHTLARFSLLRQANEWIKVQNQALEQRQRRQAVIKKVTNPVKPVIPPMPAQQQQEMDPYALYEEQLGTVDEVQEGGYPE